MKQDRSNLDFLDGPVWIEELNRWVVEIFYPDGSRIRKRFRREKDAKVFWGGLQKSIQDGSWRQEIEKRSELTLDEAFEKYSAYSRVKHRSFRKFTKPGPAILANGTGRSASPLWCDDHKDRRHTAS